MSLPTRDEALQVLQEHVKDEYQVFHAQMVAKALEAYARKFNEDSDLWYITGLLHDLDYFEFPNEHPAKSIEWFAQLGYPEELHMQ
jgi:predicted hydrolase (HD superfamily)